MKRHAYQPDDLYAWPRPSRQDWIELFWLVVFGVVFVAITAVGS